MKLLIIMTKLLSILANTPSVMSGCAESSNSYYREFLEDFKSKELNFGSMSEDKANYSSDVSKVYDDLKNATANYLKLKGIGE